MDIDIAEGCVATLDIKLFVVKSGRCAVALNDDCASRRIDILKRCRSADVDDTAVLAEVFDRCLDRRENLAIDTVDCTRRGNVNLCRLGVVFIFEGDSSRNAGLFLDHIKSFCVRRDLHTVEIYVIVEVYVAVCDDLEALEVFIVIKHGHRRSAVNEELIIANRARADCRTGISGKLTVVDDDELMSDVDS